MKILIVDDLPADRHALRRGLEAAGHAVVEAGDGVDALATLESAEFDAVISDVFMPRMDGCRLCAEIRQSERHCRLPFVVHTATHLSADDETWCLGLGADAYLRKPASPQALIAAIQTAIAAGPRPPIPPPEATDGLEAYSRRLVTQLEQENIELLEAIEQEVVQAAVLATLASAVVITDASGVIQWVNRAFTELTGYSLQEAVGQTPRILRSGAHDDPFYEAFWQSILNGGIWRGEFTNRRKDGSLYTDEHTVTPVKASDGTITHFVAIMQDVTERRRIEAALRESEERFRSLIGSAHDAVISADSKGVIFAWNTGAEAIFGYSAEEAIGQTLHLIIPESFRAAHDAGLERYRTTGKGTILGQVVELVATRKGGEEFPVELTLSSWGTGEGTCFSAIIRDVTERKRIENALRESEEKFAHAFHSNPAMLVLTTLDGRNVDFNQAYADFLGFTREELLGKSVMDLGLITQAERDVVVERMMQGSRSSRSVELAIPLRDRKVRTVLLSAQEISLNGVPHRLSTLLDVTEHRRTEAELRDVHARLERIVATAPGVVCSFQQRPDGTSCFPFGADRLAELCGLPPEPLSEDATALFEAVHPDDLAGLQESVAESARTLTPWTHELRVRHPDGRERWLEGSSVPQREPDGTTTWHGIVTDITERKRAEEERAWQTAFLQAQVEASFDGILVVDPTGKKILQNARFNELWNLPPEILASEDDAVQVAYAISLTKNPEEFGAKVEFLFSHPEEVSRDEVELLDGTVLDRYSSPVVGPDGRYFGRIWTFRDISESKRAEAALRESEEKLRLVFEHASQAFYSHTIDNELTYVSPQMADLLECTMEEALRPWTEFLTDHPINAAGIELTQKAIETGKPQPPYTLELVSRKGRIVWVEVHESPILEQGKTVAIVGALTDITERVATEASRRSIEARHLRQRNALAEFIEGTPDGEELQATIKRLLEIAAKTLGVARVSVWRYTADRSAIRCEELYELTENRYSSGLELPAATYPTYFRALEELNVIAADFAQEDVRTREFAEGYLQPLGITSMLDAPIHVAGAGAGVLCHEHVGAPRVWTADEQSFAIAVANRVTLAIEAEERKQAERELAATVRFAQNTIDALSAHLCVLDESGDIIATNRAWREFADSNPPSMGRQHITGNYLDVCDRAMGEEAEQAAAFASGIRAVLKGDQQSFELEYSCHSPTVQRWFVGRVTRFAGEGAVFAVVAHENITVAKLAQAAQLESADQLRLSVEAANIGLWDWDLRTNKVMFSREWKSQLGYAEDEIADDFSEWETRVHPDDLAPTLASVQSSLMTRGPTHEAEFRMRHKDGSWRWIYARAEVTFDLDGRPLRMQGCHLDVTRGKHAEAETQLLAERLKLATESTSIGVWDWDIARDRWFATDTYFTMLGYAPEEGFSDRGVWLERLHPDDREAVEARIRAVLAGSPEPYEYEARLRHADGEYRWVNVVGRALDIDATGKPTRMIGVRIDITDLKLAEETLLDSRRRLQLAMDASSIGPWEWDFVTNEVYLSPEWKRLLGFEDEELANEFSTWGSRLHPEDVETTMAILDAFRANPEVGFDLEYRMLHKDGSYRWLRTRGEVGDDTWGGPTRAHGCHIDVTESKLIEDALRQSEVKFRQMAESIDEVFWMTDAATGLLLYVSPAYEKIWGRSRESVLASPQQWIESIHPEDRDRMLTATAHQASGDSSEEYRIVRPDGVIRWIRDRAFPILDEHGTTIRITGVAHDITAERAAEEQLVLLNNELEERIVERTSALARATTEAESASMAKSEFLSRMSHELRTPMNSVLGYAQLLEMEFEDERLANYVARILKGGRHLLDLINEVLEITRIEADRVDLSLEQLRVTDVVLESFDLVRPLAETAKVNLQQPDIDPLLFVRGDHQRLQQVLMNLMANAIKYNVPAGSVTVSARRQGDSICIEVADTGVGIAPGMEHRLFTPFERLSASDSTIEGTGLGLSLSRKLCQAMGGTLEYRPAKEGKGSVFSVVLPNAPAPESSEVSGPMVTASPALNEGGKLLYIEDNLSNVEIIQEVMARYPAVQFVVAMQGRMGLDLAEEHHPDLILLDLHLPDMDGSQVLAQLKASPNLADIPVIILSADATQRQVERLLAMGASAYMTKPFALPELIAKLREVFAGREPGRDTGEG